MNCWKQQPEEKNKDDDECGEEPDITLEGSVDCFTRDTQKVFCWDLWAHNPSERDIDCADICLSIRSTQKGSDFELGPGLFGEPPPDGPTYLFDANGAKGSFNESYNGTGLLFTAVDVPPGSINITVCAVFSPITDEVRDIELYSSIYTFKPKCQNVNWCKGAQLDTQSIFISPDRHCNYPEGTLDPEVLCDPEQTKFVLCQNGCQVVLGAADMFKVLYDKSLVGNMSARKTANDTRFDDSTQQASTTFTVVVTNTGTAPLADIALIDAFDPAGNFTIVSIDFVMPVDAFFDVVGGGWTGTGPIPLSEPATLEPGESHEFTYRLTYERSEDNGETIGTNTLDAQATNSVSGAAVSDGSVAQFVI